LGSLWNSASDFMQSALLFCYHLTGNYGLAIILLTVIVRLLLYPLTHKQLKSMQQLQKIQPKISAFRSGIRMIRKS